MFHIWGRGSEQGPNAHYKNFQLEEASKSNKNVRAVKISVPCTSMMDRLISVAQERSCRGYRCLFEYEIFEHLKRYALGCLDPIYIYIYYYIKSYHTCMY